VLEILGKRGACEGEGGGGIFSKFRAFFSCWDFCRIRAMEMKPFFRW